MSYAVLQVDLAFAALSGPIKQINKFRMRILSHYCKYNGNTYTIGIVQLNYEP